MSHEPVPRQAAEVIRRNTINALDHAIELVKPYLGYSGFFERRELARRAKLAAFETDLQAYLQRLEAARRAVLASDELAYGEALVTMIARQSGNLGKILQDLALTEDNAFAEDMALHLFDLWKKSTQRILSRYGF
ncbi:hypothetical protein AB0A74_09720 [Saccharothrix sp. NPDC042600]|uniref:hypothetical protein n=1 Tax=Saccharothrix TaxID=2071 RepID=UPI0033F672D2|nr:hypothetical protein GCM10017745_35830 [Saccharothrix mutabilis subsp. capreolus]